MELASQLTWVVLEFVRIATDQPCYLNFGTSAVTATVGDILHIAGVEIYAVPTEATHFAAAQAATGGTLNYVKMGD